MLSTNSLLIVGGSGFIGAHLVREAIAHGYHTTVLSLHKPNENKQIAGVEYLVANIGSYPNLAQVLENRSFRYVVNLGGYVNHKHFSDGGKEIVDVHLGGVLNLVQCLDRTALKLFVQIGSSDEYGDNPAPQNEVQRETPISPYSFAKTAAVQFLQMLHRTEDFPSVTLRLFLTYGPGQDNQRFMPQIIRGCLEDHSFPTSEGGQLRDFCYVQDTVDAVFAAFESTSVQGEVINIASGKPVSIRQVIETIQRIIGKGRPQFGDIPYRTGENMQLYADISKALGLLHWTPKVSLDAGIEKTIEWIKNGP